MYRLNSNINSSKFSQSWFEAIALTATDSILISDNNSIIIFANKKAYETFGYDYEREELLGLNMEALMPERYRKGHSAGIKRFLSSGVANIIGKTIEIEGLRKDGSEFALELSLSSWKEEDRFYFSGIIRDITKRKEILREKEEAFLLLQEQQKENHASQEELKASEEELRAANEELLATSQTLKDLNEELEKRVSQRTHQLEMHQEWLHSLFMQVPALIGVLKGREGVIVLFNDMFSRLWGNREVMGLAMREAWPELEGKGYFEFIESIYDTGKAVVRKEYPGMIDRHNNGNLEQAYFNFIYAPYFDKDGNVEGTIIYGEDVTEQVLARKSLEENAERFRFMANSMPQKVWTAKPDGNVDYLNNKWLEYTGLTAEELKDWGWKGVVHPDDWLENERLWKQSIEYGNDFQLEHRFKRKDGEYRWHLSRGLAQRGKEGQINMWIGTNTDIHDFKVAQVKIVTTESQLRKSNEELKKINNDLDNFIYTASHDLKSPITNLEGLLFLVKKEFGGKFDLFGKNLLEMMEKSINRLKGTIISLTEITKVQKGFEEQAEKVSFKEVLNDIKADLAGEIEKSRAIINEELQVTEILYPKKDLRSIIYNLLSNAIKYRSEERRLVIHIRTCCNGDTIILSFKDNGIGLNEKQVPKLFTMFKRLHSYGEGTGIGLYILKRIVENNRGRIEVESKENVGSTFKVYIKKY